MTSSTTPRTAPPLKPQDTTRKKSGGTAALAIASAILLGALVWGGRLIDLREQTPSIGPVAPHLPAPTPNAFPYFVAAGKSGYEAWPMFGTQAPVWSPEPPRPPGQTGSYYDSPPPGYAPRPVVRPAILYGSLSTSFSLVDIAPPTWPVPSNVNNPIVKKAASQLVQVNEPEIALVRAGLRYQYCCPRYCPPTRAYMYLSLGGNGTPAYLRNYEGLARILAFRSEYFAENSSSPIVNRRRPVPSESGVRGPNTTEWLRSALDAVELGQVVCRGGRFLDALYGHTCASIGRVPLWRHLDMMTDGDCRQGIRRLETIEVERVPLTATLREERACVLIGLKKAFSDWRYYSANNDPDERDHPDLIRMAYARAITPPKTTVLAHCTAHLDALIDAAGKPFGTPAAKSETDPYTDQVVWKPTIIVSDAIAQAGNQLLLTALALRAYRLEHGKYPSTLSTLVPGYLKVAPHDPLTVDAILKYRPTRNGYLLYSVGPDGKDDGGVPIDTNSDNSPNRVMLESKNDMVAGVNNG